MVSSELLESLLEDRIWPDPAIFGPDLGQK